MAPREVDGSTGKSGAGQAPPQGLPHLNTLFQHLETRACGSGWSSANGRGEKAVPVLPNTKRGIRETKTVARRKTRTHERHVTPLTTAPPPGTSKLCGGMKIYHWDGQIKSPMLLGIHGTHICGENLTAIRTSTPHLFLSLSFPPSF